MINFFLRFKKHSVLVAEALLAYQTSDYAKARKLAQIGLRRYAKDEMLLLILGNTCFVEQDYFAAANCYQQILQLNPHNLEALQNLGEALLRQKKYAEAAAVIAQIDNENAALLLRAKLDFEQENYLASESRFRQYLSRNQNDFWSYNLLSQAAQKNGHYRLALSSAMRAVDLSNGQDSQHLNLAYALYEIALEKGVDFVLPCLKKWCRKYADSPIAQQSWHAFFPAENFARSNADYVRLVFDNFADSFDETLAGLGYAVPQKIAAEITAHWRSRLPNSPRILDLGCGTGLCAEALRFVYSRAQIFGVDLSAQMLQKASAKKLYRQLECADLNQFLRGVKNKFDLIVAADVFTYFGALDEVLKLCCSSLKKNGVLIFSASQNSDHQDSWQQHLSGRFLHGRNYLEKVIKKAGFHAPIFANCALRQEAGKDVCGWIISASKK